MTAEALAPAIIEAATAKALQDECYEYLDDIDASRLARAVLAVVTPLLLEKAARVADRHASEHSGFSNRDNFHTGAYCVAKDIADELRELEPSE